MRVGISVNEGLRQMLIGMKVIDIEAKEKETIVYLENHHKVAFSITINGSVTQALMLIENS